MNDPSKTKVVFMGTSSFAQRILAGLIKEKYDIRAVYTQPPKKSGRDQKVIGSPVEEIAKKNKLEVFTPEKFDDAEISKLKNFDPELIVVASYGKILPKSILDIPTRGCLNVHASILPKYRGPSPIQNAILEGETETGVTIMLMDEGIDTGDILSFRRIEIRKDDLFPVIHENLSELGKNLLLETIPSFLDKKIKPLPQDKNQATLCQLIEREDGRILWSDEVKSIYNRYRAFYSWPGIYTFWEKDGRAFRIKLRRISFTEEKIGEDKHLGEVFFFEEKLYVKSDGGNIILEELQIEGKSPASISDFLNGYPDIIGTILK
jgi:methionyl-tRNA formyltransferase